MNKQNVKKSFMIKFYIQHSENLYTFQNAKYYIIYNLIPVAKACEKVLRLNMSESRKVSFIVEKSYNEAPIDFNFGRHKVLSTLK